MNTDQESFAFGVSRQGRRESIHVGGVAGGDLHHRRSLALLFLQFMPPRVRSATVCQSNEVVRRGNARLNNAARRIVPGRSTGCPIALPMSAGSPTWSRRRPAGKDALSVQSRQGQSDLYRSAQCDTSTSIRVSIVRGVNRSPNPMAMWLPTPAARSSRRR